MSDLPRFQPNPDGWIQLAVKGEHPWVSPDGKQRIIQVIDETALKNMLRNFEQDQKENRMLLLDYDHESHDMSKRTTAAGWIQNMQIRPDGLWGQVKWTNQGEQDVNGGHYRFISPTFAMSKSDILSTENGVERIRPSLLLDAALTNKPNLRGMQPLTNRNFTSEAATSEPNKQTNQGVTMMDYKAQLLKLLGLAADATDQEISDAIAKSQQSSQAATNRVAELTKSNTEKDEQIKTLNTQRIEDDLNKHGVEGEAREPWRKLLAANREEGLKALAALPKSQAKAESKEKPLHNREGAGTPNTAKNGDAAIALKQKREAAILEYKTLNKCSYTEAFNIVKNRNPELFKEEEV